MGINKSLKIAQTFSVSKTQKIYEKFWTLDLFFFEWVGNWKNDQISTILLKKQNIVVKLKLWYEIIFQLFYGNLLSLVLRPFLDLEKPKAPTSLNNVNVNTGNDVFNFYLTFENTLSLSLGISFPDVDRS